jgi:hypothetical protein
LCFKSALRRQIYHARKYHYAKQVVALASYDLLIDEKWNEGKRRKQRWTVTEAKSAVRETINAAKFLVVHRHLIPYEVQLVLSAQGVTARQYLECVKKIVPLVGQEDILGLGGWCIVGKMRSQMMPVFRETIRLIIPFTGKRGIKRVHIWGVIFAPALGELLWLCDQYGIELSTDSAGPQVKPCFGAWGYADWRVKDYKRSDVKTRGAERANHVQATRQWLSKLEHTKYYREPPRIYKQLELP